MAANFAQLVSFVTTGLAAGTSQAINIPTGAVGDLLFVGVATDGAPGFTWPAGYTSLQADTADPDSQVKSGVRYRVTDGSEGSTFTLTLDASEETAAVAARLTNYSGAPEAGTAVTTAAGTPTAAPNPPALTPSWGSADVTWLTFNANDSGAANLGAGAVNLGLLVIQARSGAGAGDVNCFFSIEMFTGSTRNPAAFTLGASQEWISNTFGILGAVAPVGGQRIFGG